VATKGVEEVEGSTEAEDEETEDAVISNLRNGVAGAIQIPTPSKIAGKRMATTPNNLGMTLEKRSPVMGAEKLGILEEIAQSEDTKMAMEAETETAMETGTGMGVDSTAM